MAMGKKMLLAGIAVLALGALAVGGVRAGEKDGKGAPPSAAQQAVPVHTVVAQLEDVQLWSEFSGRLHAVDFAEIRPEVSGRVMEIRFRDGQKVNAGDVLLVIDPSLYQAAVARAEANLASARNNLNFALAESNRAKGLIETQAISKSLYDSRVNDQKVAEAARQAAEAELRQARLDLDHAYVKAPIAGQVSRAEITVGNLVQAGPNAPLLTSIASSDGIYADFEIDEATYLRDIRRRDPGADIPVTMTVPEDPDHVYQGRIQSFDNRIDSASGTIRARALFNEGIDGLLPGMTVTVRIAENGGSQAILLPQGAVGTDQDKKFVYTIDDKSRASYREVVPGKQVGDRRIILSGLNPGDRVIVDGLQYLHPDAPVREADAAPAPATDAALKP